MKNNKNSFLKKLCGKGMTYRIVNGKVVVELPKTVKRGNAVTGGKREQFIKNIKKSK